MTESDRRRLISSTPHLAPDDVVQKAFTTSFRGYSEAEVRAFLKRVSEELVVTHEREVELLGTIDALEEQLRSPRPLNEPEMLDALGAETTRLLRSAHEAADEIRTRGEERSTQLVDEARAQAEQLTTEAEDAARLRTEESEARAAALVSDAEARAVEVEAESASFAEEQRQRAEREAEEHIESARLQGREMLDEAKATRERVLADLARRRSLLQAQIEALRAGRDSLLDAYRVVKRSFLEATGALSQVEARAAAERVAHENDPHDGEHADELMASPDALDAEGIDTAADAEPVAVETTPDPVGVADATDAGLADVDSLFARIRAGQTEVPVAPAPEPAVTAPAEAAGVTTEPVASTDEDEVSTADQAGDSESTEGAAATEPTSDARSEWRSRRAEVLDPLLVVVSKRAKRAAQDDQNALLDAVRRHKGRPSAAQVLPAEADLLTAWAGVVREGLDEAYGAGRVAVGGEASTADDALVKEAADTIVMPLRERISSAIDTGEDGDTSGLVERIGARFREWKNQSLEDTLEDVLVLAWSRGIYDASPDGAVLRWIPLVEGRCADCDDNGLEPTVKGSPFPTGQLHPPAHLGCRCLLAPSDT
jgi:DivIVA domain-containing protein